MLVRLNSLNSRVTKILLNWLALLAGLDLPKVMRDGLRRLAQEEVRHRTQRWLTISTRLNTPIVRDVAGAKTDCNGRG